MIRGPSGGGKTTLLNLIGTLDAPSTGTIHVMGKQVDQTTPDATLAELRLKHIGFVFQTFNLLATMSVCVGCRCYMCIYPWMGVCPYVSCAVFCLEFFVYCVSTSFVLFGFCLVLVLSVGRAGF